jgi:hypothetical protein
MEDAPSLGTSCTLASYVCFSSKPISCVVDILNRNVIQCLKERRYTKDEIEQKDLQNEKEEVDQKCREDLVGL